jgi:23S rRNA pseudouridine1911/1915/1917 synthase
MKKFLFDQLEPFTLTLNIIEESSDYICINKDDGLVVHPGAGNKNSTLVNALVARFGAGFKEGFEETVRPGIIHRLDKDTSGVILVAKNHSFLELASEQFRERKTKKVYLALVDGQTELSGKLESHLTRNPINRQTFISHPSKGKYAITVFKRLWTDGSISLVKLKPITGRTHQLRVHCKSMGHPILGDPIYKNSNSQEKCHRLMLHALSLAIPLGELGVKEFYAEPSESFKSELLKYSIPVKEVLL